MRKRINKTTVDFLCLVGKKYTQYCNRSQQIFLAIKKSKSDEIVLISYTIYRLQRFTQALGHDKGICDLVRNRFFAPSLRPQKLNIPDMGDHGCGMSKIGARNWGPQEESLHGRRGQAVDFIQVPNVKIHLRRQFHNRKEMLAYCSR